MIDSLIQRYRWARDTDRFIKKVRDKTYIKKSFDGVNVKLGASLDDEYDPMLEVCLRDFCLIDKLEYLRSQNKSEFKARFFLCEGLEVGVITNSDLKREREEGVHCQDTSLYLECEF